MSRTSNAHIDISTIQLILLHFEIGTRCLITNSSPMMSAEQRRSSKDLQCTPFEAHTQTHFYIYHFKREPREMQTHSASCTWCQAAKLSHLFSTVYTLFIVKHDEHNYNRPDCRLEDEKKTQRILCLVSNRLSCLMREFLEFFVWNKSSKKM